MKKFLKVLLIILSVAALACGICYVLQEKAKPKTALEAVQKEGVLTISYNGKASEEDKQLALIISEKLGAELVVSENEYSILLGIKEEDKVDGFKLCEAYSSKLEEQVDKDNSFFVNYNEVFTYAAVKDGEFYASLYEEINKIITAAKAEAKLSFEPAEDTYLGHADKEKAYIYDNHANLTPLNYSSKNILGCSEDLGLEYQDNFVIVCDSPNYWMKPYGLLNGGSKTTQIWTGPTGTMTFPYYKGMELLDPYDGSHKKLVDMAKDHQPELMLIALGINGVAGRDKEEFSRLYKNMISDLQAVCPNTTFVCASIYPVTKTYGKMEVINNEIITAANSWILEICEERGCFYLDTCSVFWMDDGYANPDLMRGDGLHPNKDGLTKVLEYVRTHAAVVK